MTYRTFLVAVDQTAESDARVRFACDLADSFEGHLVGACGVSLEASPLEDRYTGGAMLGEAFTLIRDLAETAVRDVGAHFRTLVEGRQDAAEWRGRLGLPAQIVMQEARAADLVILGRRSRGAPTHAVDPADVLMTIGRPVLVIPPTLCAQPVGEAVVVAWKDGREAQRAIVAALPLLKRASVVHLFECGGGPAPAERLSDLTAWLSRHGIASQAHVGSQGEQSVSDAIIGFARSQKAALIVAGGYGHSRLREWALGGVTHDLLSKAPVAVLLSH